MGDEEAIFKGLDSDLTPGRAKKWGKGTVEQWADQIHKVAQKTTYGKLPKAAAGEQIKIDARYEQAADPVIKLEIEKAGARLAMVLNTTLK